MSEVLISVENLSKAYRIGVAAEKSDTFIGAVGNFVKSPLKNIKDLMSLDTYSLSDGEDKGIAWALNDVSFEVKQGEALGIVGHNGAGKSTLLKVLSRITEPTRGRVKIRGRVSSLLEVGTGFHPELTGRENIYLNGTVLGMKKREIVSKFDEIVQFSGVSRFIDTPIKRYSSGMTVRLAFAVAAHLEPDILIIDEVLAVGDAEFQRKCIGKMKDVAGQGRTVLFVSHNIQSISALTSRCLVMEKGTMVKDAHTQEAINYYLGSRAKHSALGQMVNVEDIDVEHRARADSRAVFKKIGLGKDAGESICIGGALDLEVLVDTTTAIQGLRFGYTIRQFMGDPVLYGYTPSQDVDEGSHKIGMRLSELNLAPGEYDLCLSISSGGSTFADRHYDMLIGFGHIHVQQKMQNGDLVSVWNAGWGKVFHKDSRIELL